MTGGSSTLGRGDSRNTASPGTTPEPACSYCERPLRQTFVNLGSGPLVSSYLRQDQLGNMEPFYPYHAYVCEQCLLVQLPEAATSQELFGTYPYFSSYSDSWLQHAKRYVDGISEQVPLGSDSLVIEIASNDGYLLQYFQARGVPVLGIEPAANIAAAAQAKGIPTRVRFFGTGTARELVADGIRADLIVGNNVLAHVPSLRDFVAGLKLLLKPGGLITLEFPHLLRLVIEHQFDTVFHEHFSYLSLTTTRRIFADQGLTIVDCEQLPTHGGSLRIHAQHSGDRAVVVGPRVAAVEQEEAGGGLTSMERYARFSRETHAVRHKLLQLLIDLKVQGKSIVGYGAAGKGCVLLNYCGIRNDLLDYVVDRSPHKQGLYMPGVHLPIVPPERIAETKPDYVLILPWNLKNEIMAQMAGVRSWGGKFIVPIPDPQVYS